MDTISVDLKDAILGVFLQHVEHYLSDFGNQQFCYV